MKKILSIILGLSLSISASTCFNTTIKAESSSRKIFNSQEIVLFKTEREGEFIATITGGKICKTNEIPEVLYDKNKEYYSFYWIECEDPYILEVGYGATESDFYLKETDMIPEIKYVFDTVNKKITDYVTEELIYDFSENTSISFAYPYENTGVIRSGFITGDYVIVELNGYTKINYGDINADGETDLSDLSLLSLNLLKEYSFKGFQSNVADVNADGEINLQDLALLKQYVMNDDVKLGVDIK